MRTLALPNAQCLPSDAAVCDPTSTALNDAEEKQAVVECPTKQLRLQLRRMLVVHTNGRVQLLARLKSHRVVVVDKVCEWRWFGDPEEA
jgi:hypothetical protein